MGIRGQVEIVDNTSSRGYSSTVHSPQLETDESTSPRKKSVPDLYPYDTRVPYYTRAPPVAMSEAQL